MFFVLDTNTLVSAILKPESIPANALNLAMEKGTLIFSKETKSEFLEVITRDKFDLYVKKSTRLVKIEKIFRKSNLKNLNPDHTITCRDQTDIKFLNLAASFRARCLVTGDNDLKDINPFRGIPIISSLEFLEMF